MSVYQLEFTQRHSYADERAGITLPVVLKAGSVIVRLTAAVDTGASFCLFRREVAMALGLEVEQGLLRKFRTANSSFDAYEHEIDLSVLGVTTHAVVYFFADESINKNVLGRSGWLDRVRLGIVEHDAQVYLSPYDE